MKRREAMLAARGIAMIIISACKEQGRGKEKYVITNAQAEGISAGALNVAEFLCTDRAENVLRELVKLKDIKERIERSLASVEEREYYRNGKAAAWAAARELLS